MQKGLSSFPVVLIALALLTLCRPIEASGQTNGDQGLTLGGSAPIAVSPPSLVQFQTGNGTATSNAPVQSILQLPNGSVYVGEVLDGVPHGKGGYTDRYGSNQYGEWRHGNAYKISGKSVYADGTIEVGTWNVDGSKSGGTITWKNGRVYKGDWKLAENSPELPDGTGEMTWPDGRKYVGQFRDGKMSGPGKMTYPDGKVENGSWKDDKFLGPAK